VAEFIGNAGSPAPEGVGTMIGPGVPKSNELQHGFAAMGQPVPMFRRQAALDHLEQMGVDNGIRRRLCVGEMVEALERDRPYDAMAAGMRFVDLTGTYRLMAVLLTGEDSGYIPTHEALATMDVGDLLQRERDLREDMKRHRKESWQAQEAAAKQVDEANARAQRIAEQAAFNVKMVQEQMTNCERDAKQRIEQHEATFEERVASEVARRLHGDIPEVGERPRRPVVL